ncbi:hypothetical protein [Pseudomonas indica]|uniref:Uncharacterized protein n=1 Tax=Pseudomonas indica TaxID=137658 RepID=A0A1G8V5B6_9PSED|nr:hypothetical protein [Pseudomonas indica]SDJ60545.1 hypothetical protein SAMN05216186_10284 [Pseudomonas indica]
MRKTREQWAGVSAKHIAEYAQMHQVMLLVEDAQADIEELCRQLEQAKQKPICMPLRANVLQGDSFATQLAESYNDALDEVARLNAAPIAKASGEQLIPCDVMLPPATTIRCGCSLNTLLAAMKLRDGFPEAQRVFDSPAQTEQHILSAGQRLYDELRQWLATEHDPDSQEALQAWREAIAQTAPQHPDDAAVDRFAAAMKIKLAAARAKGRSGWDKPLRCRVETLAGMLVRHLRKGNEGTFEDVANFCMMLHQRGVDPQVLAGAARPAETEQQACKWVRDADTGAYETACGVTWHLADGGEPEEHGQYYCHHCGKRIDAEGAEGDGSV